MSDAYDTCTNCGTEITDPTNPDEEARYVHLETFEVLCHVKDLEEYGCSPSEVQEQADGIANYVACPPGPGDFYKDNPDSETELPDGGLVTIWTSALNDNGAPTIHISILTPDGDEDVERYPFFVTVDGIDVGHSAMPIDRKYEP